MPKINVSQSQRARIQALLHPEEEKEELFFDRFAPEPAAELSEGQGFASTAFQNLPYSAAERFREAEQAVRDPIGLLKGLGNLAWGVGDVGAEAFGAAPTERGQMARQAGQQIMESFELENMARDPIAPVANVLGALAPFSPIGKGSLARSALAVDLPGLAVATGAKLGGAALRRPVKALGRGLATTGELAGRMAAEIPGFLTGRGGKRIISGVEAGFEDPGPRTVSGIRMPDDLPPSEISSPGRLLPKPTPRETAIAQIGTEFNNRDIGEAVGKAVEDVIDKLGMEQGAAVTAAGDMLIDVSDIKRALLGDITQGGKGGILADVYDLKVMPGGKGKKAIGARYIDETALPSGVTQTARTGKITLEFPPSVVGTDDVKLLAFLKRFLESGPRLTAKQLHGYKRQLDKIKPSEPDAGLIIGGIGSPLREKLVTAVEGYDAPTNRLHEFFKFLEDAEEELGGRKLKVSGRTKIARTGLAKRLGRAFEEGGEEIYDVVEELDKVFPEVELKNRLAAQGMTGLAPTGIVGRSKVSGAVGALTVGGGAAVLGAGIPVAILTGLATLPFFSPRFMGRAAIELGATARVAKDVVRQMSELNDVAARMNIPTKGLTVTQVINRIAQEENQGRQTVDPETGVPLADMPENLFPMGKQPSFLGRLAPASAGSMRTGVAEQYR